MINKTSIEWLYNKMYEHRGLITIEEFEKAKQMHQNEIECAVDGFPIDKRHLNGKEYYEETYGGNHIVDTNEMVEISEDQAIEMVKDMNKQPMRFHCVPKEISDDEIEQYAKQNAFNYYEFVKGAKWYREQLKGGNNE